MFHNHYKICGSINAPLRTYEKRSSGKQWDQLDQNCGEGTVHRNYVSPNKVVIKQFKCKARFFTPSEAHWQILIQILNIWQILMVQLLVGNVFI